MSTNDWRAHQQRKRELERVTPLTQQELKQHEEDLEDVQAIETQVDVHIADGREAMWRLAEALYAFEEKCGWIVSGFKSREEWAATKGITGGTYRRLVNTWRQLVVVRRIDPEHVRQLDLTKAAVVVPVLSKGRVTCDEALEDVQSRTWRELREKYRVERKAPKSEAQPPALAAATATDDEPPALAVSPDDDRHEVVSEGEFDQASKARLANTSPDQRQEHELDAARDSEPALAEYVEAICITLEQIEVNPGATVLRVLREIQAGCAAGASPQVSMEARVYELLAEAFLGTVTV